MAVDRAKLSAAEETFARILADAVLEDLLADAPEGLWIAVRCTDEADQNELADRLRADGRDVLLHSRTA